LEGKLLEYKTAGEFLADIRKEFGEGNEKIVKVAELKRAEQGEKIMEQWYNRVIILDRNWRESRQEKKRLREQQDNRAQAPRSNNQGAQW